MNGAELIAAERKRQVEEEGYTAEEDAHNLPGELASAAAAYALDAVARITHRSLTGIMCDGQTGMPSIWPWGKSMWKPTPHDQIRQLTKAGALLAAEIDRLLAKTGDNND